MRLSIIIPAYKVENFIEKCLRSLEDQDIPKTDYEIIVTNGGSEGILFAFMCCLDPGDEVIIPEPFSQLSTLVL